jgi:hypothetical protein
MWAPAVAAIGCASDSRQPEHEAVHGNGKGGCPQGQPPFFACGPRMKLKRGNGRYCYHHYYHLQHQHDLQQLHLRLTTYYCFTHQLLTTHHLLRTAYRIPQLHFATTATSTIYNAGTTTTHYNFIYDCYYNHQLPTLLHNTFTCLYNYYPLLPSTTTATATTKLDEALCLGRVEACRPEGRPVVYRCDVPRFRSNFTNSRHRNE